MPSDQDQRGDRLRQPAPVDAAAPAPVTSPPPRRAPGRSGRRSSCDAIAHRARRPARRAPARSASRKLARAASTPSRPSASTSALPTTTPSASPADGARLRRRGDAEPDRHRQRRRPADPRDRRPRDPSRQRRGRAGDAQPRDQVDEPLRARRPPRPGARAAWSGATSRMRSSGLSWTADSTPGSLPAGRSVSSRPATPERVGVAEKAIDAVAEDRD